MRWVWMQCSLGFYMERMKMKCSNVILKSDTRGDDLKSEQQDDRDLKCYIQRLETRRGEYKKKYYLFFFSSKHF